MADYSKSHQLIYAKGVNVNSVGDTPVYIPFAKFQVTSAKAANASVDLSGSSATLGLYTAAGGTGTAVVTAATGTVTPMSTAAKVANWTIASTDLISVTPTTGGGGQLFIRNGVANGSAATCDVLIEVTRWA